MGGVEDVTDLCIGISSEEGRFSLSTPEVY